MKASTRVTLSGLAALLLVTLLIGAVLWFGGHRAPEYLHGEVELREIRVAAKIAGRVSETLVREGDRVAAGESLFEIDSPEVRARLGQAEAARDGAQALADEAEAGLRDEEVEMARLDWQRAQVQAELAAASFERLRPLHAEGLIATQQFDEARAQWRASQEQARAAEARYRMAREGARSEQRRAAQAQSRQAAAAVEEVEAARAETRVVAPIDGEVAELLIHVGELAPAGFPVVTLVDPEDQWVVFHVREERLAGFAVGTRLEGEVPALGQTLGFRVTRLNPLPDFATWRQVRGTPGYDLRTFQVEARPEAPVAGLRAGMTVIVAVDD